MFPRMSAKVLQAVRDLQAVIRRQQPQVWRSTAQVWMPKAPDKSAPLHTKEKYYQHHDSARWELRYTSQKSPLNEPYHTQNQAY